MIKKQSFLILVQCCLCILVLMFLGCAPATSGGDPTPDGDNAHTIFDQAYIDAHKPAEYEVTYTYITETNTSAWKDNTRWYTCNGGSTYVEYTTADNKTYEFNNEDNPDEFVLTDTESITTTSDGFVSFAFGYVKLTGLSYKEDTTFLERSCVKYERTTDTGTVNVYTVDITTGMCLKLEQKMANKTTFTTIKEVKTFKTSDVTLIEGDFASMIPNN